MVNAAAKKVDADEEKKAQVQSAHERLERQDARSDGSPEAKGHVPQPDQYDPPADQPIPFESHRADPDPFSEPPDDEQKPGDKDRGSRNNPVVPHDGERESTGANECTP